MSDIPKHLSYSPPSWSHLVLQPWKQRPSWPAPSPRNSAVLPALWPSHESAAARPRCGKADLTTKLQENRNPHIANGYAVLHIMNKSWLVLVLGATHWVWVESYFHPFRLHPTCLISHIQPCKSPNDACKLLATPTAATAWQQLHLITGHVGKKNFRGKQPAHQTHHFLWGISPWWSASKLRRIHLPGTSSSKEAQHHKTSMPPTQASLCKSPSCISSILPRTELG